MTGLIQLEPVTLILAVLGLCALGFVLGYAVARRLLENSQRRLLREQQLESARQIQFTLVPQEITAAQNLRIAPRYVPAPQVMGNFFDIVAVGEARVCILIGDVAGRGVEAASIASILKSVFASHVTSVSDPAEVLWRMNRILCERTDRKSASAGCLMIDPAAGAMAYAHAGHTPLIVWRKRERKFDEFGGSAVALGPVPDAAFTNSYVALHTGDRVIMYSKGAIEVLDRRGRLFGEKRFKDLIRSNERLPPDQFAETITQDLLAWAGMNSGGTLKDDLTLIAVDMLAKERPAS
jgi:phosphoserine phosphatase RsbU/P